MSKIQQQQQSSWVCAKSMPTRAHF